ncbi:maker345 [Drosophila busckii]|uniref:Maker345 n=2 Tax=Drosophila busckii TaxID=30019 RepID=A0A0M4ET30_DROBS|nr:maker345 [Drosophila busckii]
MVNVTLLQDALNVSLTTRKAAMELFIEQTEAIDHMNLTEAKRHYGFQDISLSYPLMEQANASEFEDQVHNVTEYVATEAPKIYDSLYILSAVMKRLVQDKLLHRDHYNKHTQYIVEKVDHNMAMAANLSGIPDNTTIDVPSTFNTKYSSPAYGLSMEVIKLLDLISKKYQLALQYLQPAQG